MKLSVFDKKIQQQRSKKRNIKIRFLKSIYNMNERS